MYINVIVASLWKNRFFGLDNSFSFHMKDEMTRSLWTSHSVLSIVLNQQYSQYELLFGGIKTVLHFSEFDAVTHMEQPLFWNKCSIKAMKLTFFPYFSFCLEKKCESKSVLMQPLYIHCLMRLNSSQESSKHEKCAWFTSFTIITKVFHIDVRWNA